MRLLRCYALDMKEGWMALWRWYIFSAFLFSLIILSLYLDAAGHMDGKFSFGDYLVSFVAGSKSFFLSYEEPFRFPIAWGVMLMLVAYITLWYPYRDLMGMGKQVLITLGSRWTWWLSKCLWVVSNAILFWLIGCSIAFIFTLISGGSLSLEISEALPEILGFRLADVAPNTQNIEIFLFISIPCALASLCLVQLTTSFLFRPVIGYAITMSLLLLSLFYQNPLLIGNELMAARSTSLLLDGIPVLGGVVITLTIAAIACASGGLLFSWTDILDKEDYS